MEPRLAMPEDVWFACLYCIEAERGEQEMTVTRVEEEPLREGDKVGEGHYLLIHATCPHPDCPSKENHVRIFVGTRAK